jgi:uncharacterized UPF0160 family protein
MEPFYMTDKEIMQQALDTLRGLFGIHSDSGGVAVWRLGGSSAVKDAITALRSRLEQPAAWQGLTDEEIHKTTGYQETREMYFFSRAIEAKLKEFEMTIEAMKQALEALETVDSLAHYGHGIDEARETLRQAIKQAEKQEPVSLKPCRSPYCECDSGKCTHPGFYDARDKPQPAAWVGLTDEEILEAAGIDGADTWIFNTAYAIEAKLKEKNNG